MKFDKKMKVQLPLALGLSLISGYSTIFSVNAAETASTEQPSASITANDQNIAIRNIYLNDNKQLVIEFDNPAHISPPSPQVRDYPGLQHDIVLEFPQASFAVDKAPRAKALLDDLMKVYPELNSIAYATANNGKRARIRIGVSPKATTHPELVAIGENSAVINLDLSAKTEIASSAPIQDAAVSTPAVETKTESTAAESPKVVDTNKATKTVKNIKGAWHSSLKAGQSQVNKLGQIAKINPLAKLKHNKQNTKLSTPANTDIANGAGPNESANTADTKAAATPAQTTSQSNDKSTQTTADATPSNANPFPNAMDFANPVANTPAPLTPEPATTVANTPAPLTPEHTSELKPEISTVQAEASTALKTESVSTAPVQTESASEKAQPSLPRISVDPTSDMLDKVNNESIVTPLSIEQVLKEKANLPVDSSKVSASATEPALPVSKEVEGDNSITNDLKTSFSQPKIEPLISNPEAKGKGSKEETDKVASIPKNSLDILTSASVAINAATDTASTEASATPSAKEDIKLKSQKARVGGKDYFPPKFADEAIEHYNAAVRLHLSGKLTEAAAEYKAAAEADPKIAEAYSNLGLIYNQQRKYDQAMGEFHKALTINPKDAITYNGIGAAMRAKNNMVAAIKNWKTAITLDPNLASAHYNLGTAYELEKDLEKALSEYKEAVKHDQKLGEAYYRMGLILQKMNNKNLALEEYKNAIKISQQATYATDAKRRINLLSQTKNQSM